MIFDISNLVVPDSLATFRPFGYPKELRVILMVGWQWLLRFGVSFEWIIVISAWLLILYVLQ